MVDILGHPYDESGRTSIAPNDAGEPALFVQKKIGIDAHPQLTGVICEERSHLIAWQTCARSNGRYMAVLYRVQAIAIGKPNRVVRRDNDRHHVINAESFTR